MPRQFLFGSTLTALATGDQQARTNSRRDRFGLPLNGNAVVGNG